ncbi:heterokaryon incompatibility protein-domain-containing protein [Xylaria longipes]|nr:heterokaryon incompatibility protein-domain-containing protein [Xylaria longipes]
MSSHPLAKRESNGTRFATFDPKHMVTVGLEFIDGRAVVNYTRLPLITRFIPRLSKTAKPHVYQPLPQGHARFLRIVPQSNESKLIFDFITLPISVTECEEKYIAISYCWGDLPADQALVLADGSTIPITAKVVHILEQITHRTRCNVIWLDAICINQQDPIEKSGQISIMTDIYRFAESVEIWLDAGRSSGRVIEETIRNLDVSGASVKLGILRTRDSYSAYPPYTDIEIIELMWSPWFERAWVVQEYCYSKQPKFHYRGISINMLFLKRVYEWGSDLAFGRVEDGDGSRCEVLIPPMIRHFGNLLFRRNNTARRAHKMNPLEDILGEFYHCKATDPHDKVIAFLGMSNGGWLKNVTVDYERPPAAFYLDMMIAMMRYSTDFTLFGFAGILSRRPLFSDNSYVPSWLPDFSTAPHYVAWSWQWERFNASGIRKCVGVRPEFITPSIREGHMSCSAIIVTGGICIDTVVGFLPGHERRNFAYLPSFLTVALAISHHVFPYPTGESARDALWKTLIAADSSCLRRDDTGAGFDQLCEWVKTGDLDLEKIWALKGRYYQTMLVEGVGGTRGLFWTKKGYMGLAANGIKVDDEIWLFKGARVPFILRGPTMRDSKDWNCQYYYQLVAEAYVHGAMNGELSALLENEKGVALI